MIGLEPYEMNLVMCFKEIYILKEIFVKIKKYDSSGVSQAVGMKCGNGFGI